MQVLMMSERICLIMSVIIKKGENVSHACFDDAEKKSLDNYCYHQKWGECECMNT